MPRTGGLWLWRVARLRRLGKGLRAEVMRRWCEENRAYASSLSNPLAGENGERNPDDDEQGKDRHRSSSLETNPRLFKGKTTP